MTDIVSEVGVEIKAGSKNVDTSIDRVISDLKNLNATIKSTSNVTAQLKETFGKLGVSLDGSVLKNTMNSLNSSTLKYNTTSNQTVTITKQVKGNK